jgi:hypothetical protein
LIQLINTGINNTADMIGIYPGDKESFEEFKVFNQIISGINISSLGRYP